MDAIQGLDGAQFRRHIHKAPTASIAQRQATESAAAHLSHGVPGDRTPLTGPSAPGDAGLVEGDISRRSIEPSEGAVRAPRLRDEPDRPRDQADDQCAYARRDAHIHGRAREEEHDGRECGERPERDDLAPARVAGETGHEMLGPDGDRVVRSQRSGQDQGRIGLRRVLVHLGDQPVQFVHGGPCLAQAPHLDQGRVRHAAKLADARLIVQTRTREGHVFATDDLERPADASQLAVAIRSRPDLAPPLADEHTLVRRGDRRRVPGDDDHGALVRSEERAQPRRQARAEVAGQDLRGVHPSLRLRCSRSQHTRAARDDEPRIGAPGGP